MILVLASASPRRRALIRALGYPVEYREADVAEVARPGESPAETALRLAREKSEVVASPHPSPLPGGDEPNPLDPFPAGEGGTTSRGQCSTDSPSPLGKGVGGLGLSPASEGGGGSGRTQPGAGTLPTEPRVDEARIVVGGDTVVVAGGRILGKPESPDEARSMLRELRAAEHQVITGVCLIDLASGGAYAEAVETRVWMRDYSDDEVERYVRSGAPLDKAGAYGIQDADLAPVGRIEGCYLNVVGLPLCAVARGLRALGHDVPAYPTDECRCGEWARTSRGSSSRR